MTSGLLVMSYGTPERMEDVAAYYTHIRGGRRPADDLLRDLVDRYEAIGGPTALNRITGEQAMALGSALDERGIEVPVGVGFKHVAPFIGEAIEQIAARGATSILGLVLAPHYSFLSIAEYERYAREGAPPGVTLDVVRSWHDGPRFIAFLAALLSEVLEAFSTPPVVVFTAHSVPARSIDQGDPYAGQLLRTAQLVAEAADVGRWTFAYQSAGRTTGAWLGPDILDVIEELADAGETAVAVQSIGFVADHLEILYDLDVEARQAAESKGMAYARARMPNADPEFIGVLVDVVESRLGRSS